jgi:FlaA1/EpsC-like NDP-sugar epimerase
MQKNISIKNKRILIAGGAGSIGSELVRQLAPNNKIFILDIAENAYGLSQELDKYWVKPRIGDIRSKDTISDLFEDFKPQIVINAAAYKEVPPLEKYPKESIDTNVLGNYNLMHEAQRWECLEKYIYISTDKAVNPTSVMGASKRLCEIMVRNAGFTVVRFGNVMGSRGSLLPIWQKQHDQGLPLTVTDSRMTRYFMTIPEACSLVIKAIQESRGGEIYIMKMGQKYNILDLAQEIIKTTNQKIKVIGIRPGESLTEDLMSEEEKKQVIETNNFYVIKNM